MNKEKRQSRSGRWNKDYYGGGLMLLLGLGAIWQGFDYQIGTLSRMGPGYFPVAIGAILALMGILIMAGAISQSANGAEHDVKTSHPPEWRGWSCIIAANIAFVVLGRYGGLLPATFAVVFISALGDRQNSLKNACLLAIAMVVVCLIVFAWALQLQFPLFRWG
jgi:hypothetical protein